MVADTMRLDKFLAECGIGTRSEVKSIIKKGRVTVNGVPVNDGGYKVRTGGTDVVMLDGRKLEYEQFRYYMLNKPQGCVSATRDGLSTTVLEYLDGERTDDLFPVGRLDKDTVGFLLLTNDGQLGHELTSPKKHVDKTYLALVDKELSGEDMEVFSKGLDIGDDKPTLPAVIKPAGVYRYEVVLREGRFHQVKRMFEALGSTVLHLERTAIGRIALDPKLAPGEWRRLTAEEVETLKHR